MSKLTNWWYKTGRYLYIQDKRKRAERRMQDAQDALEALRTTCYTWQDVALEIGIDPSRYTTPEKGKALVHKALFKGSGADCTFEKDGIVFHEIIVGYDFVAVADKLKYPFPKKEIWDALDWLEEETDSFLAEVAAEEGWNYVPR